MYRYVDRIVQNNLDQCFVNIFDQGKLFKLIDFVPGPLYEVKPASSQSNEIIFPGQSYSQNIDQGFFPKIRQLYRYVYLVS